MNNTKKCHYKGCLDIMMKDIIKQMNGELLDSIGNGTAILNVKLLVKKNIESDKVKNRGRIT